MSMEETVLIKAPQCISDDGKHSVVDTDDPFHCECEYCFERFVLVSETVLKNLGVAVRERKFD